MLKALGSGANTLHQHIMLWTLLISIFKREFFARSQQNNCCVHKFPFVLGNWPAHFIMANSSRLNPPDV
jgi:hypothetical protein